MATLNIGQLAPFGVLFKEQFLSYIGNIGKIGHIPQLSVILTSTGTTITKNWDSKDGGLGLFKDRIRALAIIIREFVETAINPVFRYSL